MFPHSTVTIRRLPTLWASLRPRSPRSSKASAHSQPASSLWKLETVLPQASLDFQQDLGPCRKKLVVPLLPGPVTQVCDENSKQAQMMKTRVALFSHASHARKIVLAFSLEGKFQVKCKSDSMSARVVLYDQPIANYSGEQNKDAGSRYSVNSVVCTGTATFLARHSKPEEARDVVHRFAPFWQVLNARLRAAFADNDDIAPSIDVRSQTLDVADRKMRLFSQSSSCSRRMWTLHRTAHVSHTQTFSRVCLKRSSLFAARIDLLFLIETVFSIGTLHVSRAMYMA